jgi:uncharacterized repeat protein (TIGR01451 family)
MTGRRMRRIVPAIALALAMSLVVAWAFWTAPGAGVAAAASGSLAEAVITVPATAVNSVTVTWSQQATLVPASAQNSAITYSVERRLGAGAYAAVTSGGCSGAKPHGTTSCADTPPAAGSYSYRVVATYNTWTATSSGAGPVSLTIDATAPANAITLSGVTGGAFKSGSTVYYRGAASGSFTLTNAVSDGGSGPAASETAALSGIFTGWTHSPSRVSTPAGGPYVSNAFAWSALTMSSPSETVTGSDVAGNTAATTLTFTDDSVAPAGGTVDATGLGGTGGRYSTSTTLSIAFTAGTDSESGLATSGAQLLRASASLGDGSCGTYGSYAQVGANDPASPVANTVPVDHTCYRYRYVVSDRVGNQGTYTSPDIKVDTAAPHPDFLQPITSPETVRAGPAGLATGDVDNDGDQDIVTSAIFESTTSVLINNGVGAFREQTVVSNAATIDVGLGKFDNDSNLDLVLLYQGTPPGTGLLIIFKGGGDGSFTYLAAANEIVNTGVRSVSLAVGDFNGDTIDDVAVVNSQNNVAIDVGTVMTFLGNPAGTDTFSAAPPAQTLNAQIGATDIAFADFNGGAKDLVVTNSASSSITFLAGNGTGFNAPANIAAGAQLAFLDTANLNAGTNRDIVATVRNSNPSAVRTLFGDGAGGFPTQATTTAGTGATPQAVVAKDFDNDADVDVALANGAPETISVLANDGTGAYTIAPASPEVGVGGAGALPYGLVSADFDGSGYNDLAASPVFTSPGELRMLLNQNGNRANLSIAQTDAPDPVTTAGQSLTYTLTVTNAGASTPSSVKARDRLPTGVTFNAGASSPSCTAAGAAPVTVTCDYGSVASGSPESQQVVVTTSAATPSSLTNTATVAGNLADPTPANNTSSATTTVVDASGPSGGSVDASGLVGTGARYSTSTALSIALSKGSDPSGLATSGAQLRRSTATLTSGGVANGSCGSYSASVQVGANDPVSPVADTVPAGQACYRYEYVVADTLGNSTTYTSPDIKVDTTAPATPTLALSAFTNTYWNGSTLYYRSNAASGAFTLTAGSTDANSGIASYALPTLPAGWTGTAGALGVKTYSWSAPNPTAPSGAQNTTATNNATLASAAAGLTLASDVTAPATGNVTYTDGYYTSASVSVSFARGTDGGSGVNATSGLLQRAEATLTGGACGSYSGFATITGGTNPTSPFTDTSVNFGKCYQYRYLASDNVGNQATYTSANVAKVTTYSDTVASTTGLVNHWRLGETYVPVATDTFNIGAAGADLSSRAGELGATWTNWGAPYGVTTTLVLSNETRVRKSGTGFNYYRASATPASADYAVEMDVYVKSLVTGDKAGVVGRFDPAGGGLEDWYEASYDVTTGSWVLRKSVNQTLANLTTGGASAPQTLTANQAYRLRLEMIGTSIKLYVDGVLKVSGTDASVTLAGKGGVFSGNSGATSTVTNTTGLHLDNFQIVPTTAATAADSKGTATGTYFNGPTLGMVGPLSGDSNTAVSFDGVDDYVSAARQVQDDLSVEFWFKSTQGLGTNAQWWGNAGLVDAEVAGAANDFGLSLRSDGRITAGTGTPDASIVSSSAGYNDGNWHHVVFTRTRSSGALNLYVDGASAGSATGSTASLTAPASIDFGRIHTGTNYFAGSLDEVATYNVALSQATVTAHYQAR